MFARVTYYAAHRGLDCKASSDWRQGVDRPDRSSRSGWCQRRLSARVAEPVLFTPPSAAKGSAKRVVRLGPGRLSRDKPAGRRRFQGSATSQVSISEFPDIPSATTYTIKPPVLTTRCQSRIVARQLGTCSILNFRLYKACTDFDRPLRWGSRGELFVLVRGSLRCDHCPAQMASAGGAPFGAPAARVWFARLDGGELVRRNRTPAVRQNTSRDEP